MTIAISAKTQELIEEQMKNGHFDSPDQLMQKALEQYARRENIDFDDLDSETQAAIEEAEAEFERGDGRPWSEVRHEVLARFSKH